MLGFTSALVALSALLPTTLGHYTFPNLIINGVKKSDWQYIRRTHNYVTHFPLFELNNSTLRCFEDLTRPSTSTLSVRAGSTVGFTVDGRIIHEGPLVFYMAAAGPGKRAASMTGAGPVWFKIFETHPEIGTVPAPIETFKWPQYNASEVFVQIPPCLPNGEYLLRVEHIAIHIAFIPGEHEFFGACAQLKVTNGGSGTPGPLVSFPGAYKSDDPGLFLNVHEPWVQPQTYINPGPPVWQC